MANRTAKIASSVVVGILAGVALAAPRNTANAAECLTEPGKDGTPGQHWYYRIEHGTKRHCWYLRDGDGKAVQPEPESADDSAEAPTAATANSENPPRSVEDARAEYPMPRAAGNTLAAPAPGPASLPPPNPAPLASSPPQADAQGSSVAARWPSPETAVAPTALAATAPSPATAPAAPQVVADAAQPAPATDAAAETPAPSPEPVAANTAPAKPSVSLQMLFAVVGGALALAGLTASVVYRFGRRKQRRLATSERRAVLWDSVENGPRPPWVPPEIEEETPPPPPPQRRPARSAKVQPERYEKIEEILAQLVKQGQQSDA